jgi:beta-N-acetylhexosaminidase
MMGRELAALGINWNLAPVADLARQPDNPSIGTRAFGRNPRLVSDMVAAQIRGFQRAGVAATAKHFPGLGNTVVDTHDAPAQAAGSLDDLYQEDLAPFRAAIAADVGCIMLTHVIYDKLDTAKPATLSPQIASRLLRDELGYDGVVCTDCMEMKAITDAYGAGESAALAIEAGVDLVLFSHSRAAQAAAYEAVLASAQSGRLSAERIHQSAQRIRMLKRRYSLVGAPSIEIVGCDAHRSLAALAARAGLVLLRRGGVLPLGPGSARVGLIEFSSAQASGSSAEGAPSQFADYLSRRLPGAKCVTIDPASDAAWQAAAIDAVLRNADTIILLTRNAHMQPAQMQTARFVYERARVVILICARNPYDAGMIAGADTILCTNGDSKPSLLAAVDALCGDYIPAGRSTVEI